MTDHSPPIVAAGAAIRQARFLAFTHSDEEVAQIVVDAYHVAIKEGRAAKARSKSRPKTQRQNGAPE
jgi:hypothetical protein